MEVEEDRRIRYIAVANQLTKGERSLVHQALKKAARENLDPRLPLNRQSLETNGVVNIVQDLFARVSYPGSWILYLCWLWSSKPQSFPLLLFRSPLFLAWLPHGI